MYCIAPREKSHFSYLHYEIRLAASTTIKTQAAATIRNFERHGSKTYASSEKHDHKVLRSGELASNEMM